jgi:hypothetical protein
VSTRDYSVLLEGVDALDLSVSVLRDLCDLLVEGAQRATRLAAEGRSVARGGVPGWVSSAGDLHITRFEQGSLDLGVRADRLADAAPDAFSQQDLFPSWADPDLTAFDLLLEAIDDASSGKRDSDRLDPGILDVLARTNDLFAKGSTRLSLCRVGSRRIVLDQAAARAIRTLAEETPPSRISRVRGVLDTLTVSTKTLALRLADGRLLRGFAGDVDLNRLKQLLGAEVLLEGWVTFRPSGDAQRIEVESALAATPGDVLWARLPRVEPSRSRQSTAGAGLDALFGKWPGDETDEELATALKHSS